MKQPEITHILFDIGGVLTFLPQFDFLEVDKKFALTPGQTEQIFHDCFRVQTDNKEIDLEAYFNANHSQHLHYKEYQKMLKEIYGGEKLNNELVDWIRNHKNEYSFSVLSNNSAVLNDVLKEKFHIYDDFDHIFNSAEIGLVKPNPEIFHFVLDKLNVPAIQCLFVDDRLDNVEAARSVGLTALQFISNEQFFEDIKKVISIE
ncbi:MAG: HAD family phosphatase [Candidatus Paceibacterota bacterium]